MIPAPIGFCFVFVTSTPQTFLRVPREPANRNACTSPYSYVKGGSCSTLALTIQPC